MFIFSERFLRKEKVKKASTNWNLVLQNAHGFGFVYLKIPIRQHVVCYLVDWETCDIYIKWVIALCNCYGGSNSVQPVKDLH